MATAIASSRPYILSSTRNLLFPPPPFLLPTKRHIVSVSFISLNNNSTQTTTSSSYCNKLLRPNNDAVSSGLPKLRLFHGLGNRRFATRATNVNNAGSIDSPLVQSMDKKIKEQLNAESVMVKDAYGDGRHVSIDIVSSAFEGQSAVNRQRTVCKAIWEELQNTVHAVDRMTTKTPSEAAAQK